MLIPITTLKKDREVSLDSNPFAPVLRRLLDDKSRKIANGFLMLKANYRAHGRKITASNLAKAAGYPNYGTGNEQYGSFAHKVCELLGVEPTQRRDGTPIWTLAICDASEETDKHGHFQWVLKKDVADALEQIGIVKPTPTEDVLDDLREKDKELSVLTEKTRDAVIKSRIGQSIFRERLVNHWEGCSVTGYTNTDLLIASHIKPWRDCSPSEALTMTNGLLLLPNIDLAFDRGFISFAENGEIIYSPQFKDDDARALGISPSMQLRWCYPQHNEFLEYHRINVLRTDD